MGLLHIATTFSKKLIVEKSWNNLSVIMTKTRGFYVVLCKHNLNWFKKIHIWWQKIESKSKALFKRASKNAYNKLRTLKLVVFSTHFLCFFTAVWDLSVLHRTTSQTKEPFKAPPFLCVPSFLARIWQRGRVWHGVLASWVITTGDWMQAW